MSKDLLNRVRTLGQRCSKLADMTPVAGEPDPYWHQRQDALRDAAVFLLNDLSPRIEAAEAEIDVYSPWGSGPVPIERREG